MYAEGETDHLRSRGQKDIWKTNKDHQTWTETLARSDVASKQQNVFTYLTEAKWLRNNTLRRDQSMH